MSRIKERVSSLVKSQLPEFIGSDYPLFVSFVEAYYKFLEQDQGALEVVQNANSYKDIDSTADSFIQYFLKEYTNNIPPDILVDKKLLIKKISDLYESKGSPLSFNILFRILYNQKVSLNHPYDYVLRSSGGNWEQIASLRIELISGSVININDRALKVLKNGIYYEATIVRVKFLIDNLYEVYLSNPSNILYEIEDEVIVTAGTSEIFKGIIKPTTVSYEISNGGTGFKVGGTFSVSIGEGISTLVKITNVDDNGGIKELRFLNFGYNYTKNLSIFVTNDLRISTRNQGLLTKTGGFSESFQMVSPHTLLSADRYFLEDYVEDNLLHAYTGTLYASSYYAETDKAINAGSNALYQPPGSASINFYIGALGRYPGQYITNQGFLSEPEVRLQDSKLYQPFAYQLNTEKDIFAFYDIVRKLVHPAGTNLFNNYNLSNFVDLAGNVSLVTTANIFESTIDTVTVSDTNTKVMFKNFFDNVIITDKLIWTDTKPESEVFSLQDFNSFDLQKAEIDNVVTSETTLFNIRKSLEDTATLLEAVSKQINTSINNNESVVTFTELVTALRIDYAENGYFAEIYAGAPLTLFETPLYYVESGYFAEQYMLNQV